MITFLTRCKCGFCAKQFRRQPQEPTAYREAITWMHMMSGDMRNEGVTKDREAINDPASVVGTGYEADKFSRDSFKLFYDGYVQKVVGVSKKVAPIAIHLVENGSTK